MIRIEQNSSVGMGLHWSSSPAAGKFMSIPVGIVVPAVVQGAALVLAAGSLPAPQQVKLMEVITDPEADNPQGVRKGAGSLQKVAFAVFSLMA